MRKLLLGSLLTLALVGCGSSKTKTQPTTNTPTTAQREGGECPMMKDMAGAKVTATDTVDGVAIELTTTGDVAALRAHAHDMADMHNKMTGMHGDGEMHAGMGSGEMHEGMGSGAMHGGMKMVPSKATVEDTAGGARIVLVPNDPSQLAELRDHAREHAAMMNKGECPMATQPQQAQPGDEHSGHHPQG
jgi:hypothetical protein